MYYSTEYHSPIGIITIVSDEQNIIGLWIEGQKHFFSTINNDTIIEDDKHPILKQAVNWLERYFDGEVLHINNLPIAPKGSDFRQSIWEILTSIPYGKTMTYGEIANILSMRNNGTKMSARAVGGAVGHNPISIIIPCHRVIGKSGDLTGYAGGIDKKIALLKIEKIIK